MLTPAKSANHFKYSYLYIFLLALIIRIFVVALIPAEFWECETISTNILNGKGFTFSYLGTVYRSYMEPFYPLLSALLYFLTQHNVFILEIIQAIFSSATAVVVYFGARYLFGQRAAAIAGLLVALHPGLIVYTAKLHPLTFDAFFISLVLLLAIRLAIDLNRRNLVIFSLVGGLSVTSRPTILLFLPLALVYIFMIKKISFGRSLTYFFLFLALSGAMFLPWTVRNCLIHKQFILTRSGGSFVFWLGNNPNFSGSALAKNRKGVYDLAPKDFKEKIEGFDEIAQNKEFLNASFEYIKKYPFRFIERTLKKFYYFWWFSPQVGLLYPKAYADIYKIYYFIFLSLFIMGIYFSFKSKELRAYAFLFLLLFLAVASAQALTYVECRHRWGIEPLMASFVGFSISKMASAWLRKSKCRH